MAFLESVPKKNKKGRAISDPAFAFWQLNIFNF